MPSHREQRFVPYSPDQMFALVADIERYPEFIPWCAGARIRRREGALVVADLRVRFGPFRESFTSRVSLTPPERIDVAYAHGPLSHMATHWRFLPAEGGTVIDFSIDCDFRSALLRGLASRFFHEAAKRMALAFEARAHKLHGDETGPRGDRPIGQERGKTA